jgi:2-methylcitrate dehydratase
MPARITVRLQDSTVIEHEVQDYPGLASRPFTWEDSVEKFDRLVDGRADEDLSREIKDAVRSLESIEVKDLMQLLGRVTGGKRAIRGKSAA